MTYFYKRFVRIWDINQLYGLSNLGIQRHSHKGSAVFHILSLINPSFYSDTHFFKSILKLLYNVCPGFPRSHLLVDIINWIISTSLLIHLLSSLLLKRLRAFVKNFNYYYLFCLCTSRYSQCLSDFYAGCMQSILRRNILNLIEQNLEIKEIGSH